MPELLPNFSPVELAVGRYTAYGAISFGLMLPRLRRLLRQALSGNLVYYMLLALGVTLAGGRPRALR